MIKIKHIFLLVVATVIAYACNNDSTSVENFDHAAQALIDQDSLELFLSKHYYDTEIDSVKLLVAGKTPLIEDEKLFMQEVTENDIDYKMYYYVKNVGTPDPEKGHPTVMDSIFATYEVRYMNTTESNVFSDKKITPLWFEPLSTAVRGWSYGFTHFKGGKNVSVEGEPITYENGGEGVLFIPSGLAYRNFGSGRIPANSNLLFYIKLYDIIEDTDHDNDGVPSINEIEDASEEDDPRFVDTDEDRIPNYVDIDDDNDRILTKDEDVNENRDPTDDDTDNDGVPNYLDNDDDNDGVLTVDEDTNRNGDPTDDDSDNDGIPNYLDPDSN